MSIWQVAFATILLAASLYGGAGRVLLAAMWLNFAGSLLAFGEPWGVATADIAAATIILALGTRSGREIAVAVLFVLMPPVYWLGFSSGWQPFTTYGIMYVLAVAQVLIVGRPDGGYRVRKGGADRVRQPDATGATVPPVPLTSFSGGSVPPEGR